MKNGWQEVPLGEVLTERKETPTSESLENGEVGIVSKIGFKEGRIEVRVDGKTKTGMILARPGDLVISGINATKGAIAIYPEVAQKPIAATIHYGAYIPNKERVDIKYLWWFLRSATFREIVQNHIPGGIKTELKSKRFLAVPIPLPSLKEQQSILAQIESLAARVNEAQRLREEADLESSRAFPSTLTKAFEKLEKEFQLCEIQEICTIIRGGSPRPAGDMRFYDGDFPFTKVADITKDENKFMFDTVHTLTELGTQSSRLAKTGTILLTVSGATLGVPKISKIDAYFNDGIVAFPNLSDEVFSEYFYYFLKSRTKWFRDYNARGQGLPNLNTDMLRPMKFPLPPLDEQRRIVAYLDSVQARLAAVREVQSATGEELDALLPSILDKAFKGEL